MKRTILVMCIGLFALAAHSQYDERDRLVSINPLRNGDGSFMKANNPIFHNSTSTDTATAKKEDSTPQQALILLSFELISFRHCAI